MKIKDKINKKYLYIIILIIILIIFLFIILSKKNNNKKIDIYPEEEISEQQYRQTMVLLYFINEDTGEIETENRIVDVKKIINNPYESIVNMLIEGGKNNKLKSYIPKNTKIKKIELNNNILFIEFSDEFLEINKLENKNKIINIIEKTLKELLEIKEIQIINK